MTIDDYSAKFLFVNSKKVDLFNYLVLISALLDFGDSGKVVILSTSKLHCTNVQSIGNWLGAS